MSTYESVLCVDLRSFDNTKVDYGVSEYISHIGFIPTEICFLNFHVMFLLAFSGNDEDFLDPICTGQNGTPCNQKWTIGNLRGLIAAVRKAGIKAYLGILANTSSPVWKNTNYSWPRPELLQRTRNDEFLWGNAVNILKRNPDGRYFEDEFISSLSSVIKYFGFDGYVAGDGMLGLRGPRETLRDTDYSEDMVSQFMEWSGLSVPIDKDYNGRADYIQKFMPNEWIEFWVWRWTVHVSKVSRMLKTQGKGFQAIDAWSRNPIEARKAFGIDYRKLCDAGLEAVFIQARETNKWRKHREGEYVREENNVFTFLSHKAYEPRLKYYWAEATVNVPEFWNTMLDLPNVAERECYAYIWTSCFINGSWNRICDGICVIWGNDLSENDWKWLKKHWDTAFGLTDDFVEPLGLSLIFDDKDVNDGRIEEASFFAKLVDEGVLIHSSIPSSAYGESDLYGVAFNHSIEDNGKIFFVEDNQILFQGIRYSFSEGVALMKEFSGIKTTSGRIFGFRGDGKMILSLENPGNLFYEKVYLAVDRKINDVNVLPPREWYSMPHSSEGGSTAVSVPPDASVQLIVSVEEGKRIPLEFNFRELGV